MLGKFAINFILCLTMTLGAGLASAGRRLLLVSLCCLEILLELKYLLLKLLHNLRIHRLLLLLGLFSASSWRGRLRFLSSFASA